MRRHAAHIFNNRRRGEWNPLLLVMFALLSVAPSVLAAAPIHNAATQPQAVWQWLQSPEGAPTRDLLQQALSECGVRNAECGILQLPCEILQSHNDIDSPLAQNSAVQSTLEKHAKTDSAWPFYHSSLITHHSSLTSNSALYIRHTAFASVLSSHEAAKLSGIRTNRFRN